ncbi:MAG: ABC transporter substrate-binding protein [Ruminococcaceae bacterium]|nr:ABC transporter substrate-binding protein [Oscillospiraceae bacterium]
MKFAKGIIAAVLCAGLLAGCAGKNAESGSNAEGDAAGAANAPTSISVTALKGPTAMGMTKLMADDETNGYPYEFAIHAAVDEISPLIIQGKTDIACVPANLASVLYNKTQGGVKVIALNTLGVLYICENGSTVTDISSLKGKTIFASGKGATPEYALNYILKQNGIDPEKDVTIEWKSEHSECLSSLTATEGSVALLPQPFVTTAQMKNEGINVVIDLTEEWDKLGNGSACITGAVIARKEFVEQHPEAVDEFLKRYAESVNYVTTNVAEGAQLVGKYDIVPAAVAEKAIPECNIVCITGAEMKQKLSGYLGVLFQQLNTSVGGALPADDFYYGA